MKLRTPRLIPLFLAGVLASAPARAAEGISTVEVLTQTAAAIPSCLRYEVKGICLWLKCTLVSCWVEISVRVSHFAPDAVVSVYHDPDKHPWNDYGAAITKATSKLGASILGMPLDSAGSRHRADRTARNNMFRDADAIGNPMAYLKFLKGGGGASVSPSSVSIPDATEMMKFPSTIGSIMQEWARVPASLASQANISGTLTSLMSGFSAITGPLSNLSGQSVSGGNSTSTGDNGTSPSGSGNGGGGAGGNSGSSGSGSMGSNNMTLYCPSVATPFSLYYQSHLDGYTWRGMLPLELLYPASWVPGIREIGTFPANTWSGVFPRDGNVVQQHFVKGASVLAQRVGDIFTRPAQPHIYTLLSMPVEANGVRYFTDGKVAENDGNSIWQRLYPNAETSCSNFGGNDSLSPVSIGDGHTSAEESYAFNLWRRYDCCEKVGQIFLMTIP
ncbi:MAG: TraU family protein [Herminiimonas sp.]|nr:TraU family protein [Herminiimonas sp.]